MRPPEFSKIERRLVYNARLFLFLLWAAVLTMDWTRAAEPAKPLFRPDRLLIRPRQEASPAEIENVHRKHGGKSLRKFAGPERVELIQVPTGRSVQELVAEYRRNPQIETAEPDYLLHASVLPNDPYLTDGTLWGLHNTGQSGGRSDADMDAPEGWDTASDAASIIVAVIDSGVRLTHEDLVSNLWVNPGESGTDSRGLNKRTNGVDDDRNGYVDDVHGMNALNGSGNPTDDVGHGTHVAGIIGASGNNGRGVVGVAWKVKMMACKFMDAAGNGAVSDAIEAIDYARLHGAKVMNASWGGPTYSSFLETAIRKTRDAGIIFVAAAGNESADIDVTPLYPASYSLDNIIVVAATTRTDELASFSNFGASRVDIAAPGAGIFSTYFSGDSAYVYLSGTSMAAPCVSGLAALMRARFPADSYSQILQRIRASADQLSSLSGKCQTGARANISAALGPNLMADFAVNVSSGDLPLTAQFTDRSYGEVTAYLWDFGDNTPVSTNHNPSHLFTEQGNFTVSLTVKNALGQSSTKTRSISVLANYLMQNAVFSWIDPSSMEAIALTDNAVSPAKTLPFSFSFYGQSYDSLFVSANGLIGFVNQGLQTSVNVDLPNASLPNAFIAPWWDDLNPSASGSSVRIGATGIAPNRRLVVSWIKVPPRSRPNFNFTFQAVLHENSDRITFQYLEVAANRNLGAGKSATIGIEDHTGLVGKKFSFNGSTLLSNNKAIEFIPSSVGGLAVTPSADFAVSGDVGGAFAPASQTYIVENKGAVDLPWAVACTETWITLSSTGGTLAPGQTAEVVVSINSQAGSLRAGAYLDPVQFKNLRNGNGNTTRKVSLAINGTTGVLTVSPLSPFSASGLVGGPFAPSTKIFTVINAGDARLDWSAQSDQTWVSFSPSFGSLAAGESSAVTLSIGEEAAELLAGKYTGSIAFTNDSNGQGNVQETATLLVSDAPDPQITTAKIEPSGAFSFVVIGPPNQAWRIEVSDDFRAWTSLMENSADAEGHLFFQDTAPSPSARFYRAAKLP